MKTVNADFVTRVMKVFCDDVSLELPILTLSKKANLNYNATHRTVQFLLHKSIFKSRRLAKPRSSLISLNKTPETFSYLMLAKSQDVKNMKELQAYQERIKNEFE